jgi:hypothetical protein
METDEDVQPPAQRPLLIGSLLVLTELVEELGEASAF